MKKYSDFVTEVSTLTISKDNKLGYDDIVGHPRSLSNMHLGKHKKISTMKGGNEVWRRTVGDTSEYMVRNKKTGIIHLTVNGYNKTPKTMKIGILSSDSKGPKAADFYQHLLQKGHVEVISTDSQSEGGKKVWMQLNKKKNVNIHGYMPDDGTGVNLGKKFDDMETHIRQTDIMNIGMDGLLDTNDGKRKYGKQYGDDLEDAERTEKMRLVAHLKTPKKKLKEEAPANAVGGGAIAGAGVGPQGEPGIKRRGKFGKYDTFLVSPDTFLKARMEKKKGKHWRTYLEEDEAFSEVREYARKHKGPVILQCERTGAMCFARYT